MLRLFFRGEPLPFALRAVLCFLLFHAAESIGRAAGDFSMRPQGPEEGLFEFLFALAPHGLYAAFDLLLAIQILLRASAALFWGVVYFWGLALATGASLVLEPARWPALSAIERARELLSIAIGLGLALALLSEPGRRTLVRD